MTKRLVAIGRGAAFALALAVAVRLLMGGYAEGGDFLFLFVLGPLALGLPTLASVAYVVWSLVRAHYVEAMGATLAIAVGLGIPQLPRLLAQSRAMPIQYSVLPKGSVLIFGDDMLCYGSTACGSELIRAGYTVGEWGRDRANPAPPVVGDKVYLTSLNNDNTCQNSKVNYGPGFGLPPECVFWRDAVLDRNFIYMFRTIDAATDIETFLALQGNTKIGQASRELVRSKTWSPYYLLGKIEYSMGVLNHQEFISAHTNVKLGD